MTDLYDIVAAIGKGEFDDDLQMIRDALAARQQRIQPEPIVGGTGRLKQCNPKYLNGAPFTIVGINRTRVVVKIDTDWLAAHPQAQARWGGRVTCPTQMLDFT